MTDTPAPTCTSCGRQRTPDDGDYHPLQIFTGRPPGWYSGDDGELCPQCMGNLMGVQQP